MTSTVLRLGILPNIPLSLGYGGLEVQQERTMQALADYGVLVVPVDLWDRRLDVDLVHIFGGFYHHAEVVSRIAGLSVPMVMTPMFVRTAPVWQYTLWRWTQRWTGRHTTMGLRRRMFGQVHHHCALSTAEAHDLATVMDVSPSAITVVPNGVDDRFFTATATAFRERYGHHDDVLCVASIEPNKNQLRLIEATADSGRRLVLIGAPKPAADEATRRYVQEVADAVSRHPHVLHIDGLDHDSPLLASAYAAAGVHVLASHAEGYGIATCEAAAAGARCVVPDLPAMHAIYGSDVDYCSPRDIGDIRQTIDQAWRRPRTTTPRPWLVRWPDVARRLVDVYHAVRTRPR